MRRVRRELVGVADRLRSRETSPFLTWQPPGHYYSPIPTMDEMVERRDELFRTERDLPGIELDPDGQLVLVESLAAFHDDFDWPVDVTQGLRYFIANPSYGVGDALVLQAMLRHLRPSRIIEIGSGWSSALMLDVADRFLDPAPHLTFIEPYPETLEKLLREGDADRVNLLAEPLHKVDLTVFDDLGPGDLLFVDSSHVVRPGSDVNRVVLDILPRLRAGVHVHIHDIFYPFEIPEEWVMEGRLWSETHLVRAMLTDNERFRVRLWNDYLRRHHPDRLFELLPKMAPNPGGALWLERC